MADNSLCEFLKETLSLSGTDYEVRNHLSSNYFACLRSADSVNDLADNSPQLSFVPLPVNLHLLGG